MYASTSSSVRVFISPPARIVNVCCMRRLMGSFESNSIEGKMGLPSGCLSAFARESRVVVLLTLIKMGMSRQ